MWRKAIRTTLDRFHDANAHDLSIVTVTGSFVTDMDAVRVGVRKLRRSLRDLRDAQAAKRASWRDVRIAGLVDLKPTGDHGAFLVEPVVRLLVHHPGVPRRVVEWATRNWFSGSGRDVGVEAWLGDACWGSVPGAAPPITWRASVVATLFEWHRGLEPLRIAVGPQRSGLIRRSEVGRKGQGATFFREPMPVAF